MPTLSWPEMLLPRQTMGSPMRRLSCSTSSTTSSSLRPAEGEDEFVAARPCRKIRLAAQTRDARATCLRNSSPASCPCVSLIALEIVNVEQDERQALAVIPAPQQ